MVEHRREHRRRIALRDAPKSLDRLGQAQRSIVEIWCLTLRRGPQQRHRLGHVADIVAAHPEQHRIDPLPRQRANHGRFHRRNVERPGQRGERQPAIRIWNHLEVSADQPKLAQPRTGIDEIVE